MKIQTWNIFYCRNPIATKDKILFFYFFSWTVMNKLLFYHLIRSLLRGQTIPEWKSRISTVPGLILNMFTNKWAELIYNRDNYRVMKGNSIENLSKSRTLWILYLIIMCTIRFDCVTDNNKPIICLTNLYISVTCFTLSFTIYIYICFSQ